MGHRGPYVTCVASDDQDVIADYASLLAGDVAACAKGSASVGPLGDQPELLRSSFGFFAGEGAGDWVDVDLVVSSEAGGGGNLVSRVEITDDDGARLVLNGDRSAAELEAGAQALAGEILRALTRVERLLSGVSERAEPSVVQAVTDEALATAERFKLGRVGGNPSREQLMDAVRSGRAWVASERLRPRDRAEVVKAALSALVDAGLA